MDAIDINPFVFIQANSRLLPSSELISLTEVRVQQRLNMPTQCELYFRAPPNDLETAESLTIGTQLHITLQNQSTPLFIGEVTAVEFIYGPNNQREIYIRGYDHLHRLRKRQSIRAIDNKANLSKLAQELTQNTNIKTVNVEENPPIRQVYFQHTSHLDLLQQSAARAGLYLTLHDNELYLISLRGLNKKMPLTLGRTLHEAHFEVNADTVCNRVTIMGWDTTSARPFKATSKKPRSGRSVRASVDTTAVYGHSERTLINESVWDEDLAKQLAQAELDQRHASGITFWGRADGNPDYRPGVQIDIEDVSPQFEGTYVVTEAIHTLDINSGYNTEITSGSPWVPPRALTDVATVGIVNQVRDPKKWGRIRVILPTYNGILTDWLPVVTPGAGKDKGFIFTPDIGDSVLVILTREDPVNGIIIGGLYGQNQPPDAGVSLEGEIKRYTWRTPGGLQIQMQDQGDVIRLENARGAYIELDNGQITFAGSAIDFKEIGPI